MRPSATDSWSFLNTALGKRQPAAKQPNLGVILQISAKSVIAAKEKENSCKWERVKGCGYRMKCENKIFFQVLLSHLFQSTSLKI